MPALDTRLPLRAAMEARDRRAAVDAFAPDAVLRSPFTDGVAFTGREQIDAIVGVVLDVLEDLTYTDELRDGHGAVLVGRASVGGQRLHFVDHLRLREDGLVEEMTVFFRPLPATTAAMRRIGAGLGRRKGAWRGHLIGAMAAPMAAMSRTGDRIGARLVRP